MSPEIPPPLRAVAGLAAVTLDEARRLPRRIVSWPVLAIGVAMQASLRFQQEYAGLVARGDEILTQLRGQGDEAPPWARFDEDETDLTAMAAPAPTWNTGVGRLGSAPSAFDRVEPHEDPVEDTSGPLIGIPRTRPVAVTPEPDLDAPEPPVAGYDGWTIAQLRARLRNFSPDQLAELLAHERAGQARAAYLTMLGNRLAGRRRASTD